METSWIYGLIGGLMIGCAGAVFLLFNGRIMGASGIFGGLIDGSAGGRAPEYAAFLLGLVALPALIGVPDTHLTDNWTVLIAAGLLVGLRTRIANGCTSGHGVCGISRLSPRGIIATLLYVGAGVASVALFRHGLGVV